MRLRELQTAFDSPDRYGKGLDWTGYTVHDAANTLLKYLLQLPDPAVPLDFYDRFRSPLKGHQTAAVGALDDQFPPLGNAFDVHAITREYQVLFAELVPIDRQLLLYLLDLIAVIASKSDLNGMTTPKLAAIFQPGLLSHPEHCYSVVERRLSQDVLIFLLENEESFQSGLPGREEKKAEASKVQSNSANAYKISDPPPLHITLGHQRELRRANSLPNHTTDEDLEYVSLPDKKYTSPSWSAIDQRELRRANSLPNKNDQFRVGTTHRSAKR